MANFFVSHSDTLGSKAQDHSRVRDENVASLQIAGSIADTTRRIIDLVGPMAAILNGRRVAILKPNFVAGRPARTGATTNLDLIAAVAEAVHTAGATPFLCEFPGTEFDFEATLTILKIDEFCQHHGIGLVRKVDRWLELHPAGAGRLRRFHVPAQLEEACLINLPVLKTHVVSGMSICMKNLMGFLPHADRRTMHTLGIQQCIVDINRGIIPDLNIVDGSIGQDKDGPLYGRQANLRMLVAGRDALAVDLACCVLTKIDPNKVGHFKLGRAQLGERHITFLGDELSAVRPMELPRILASYQVAYWLMYLLDYPFAKLVGSHLCTELYKTGLFGTRPIIVQSACNRCGDCVRACPLPDVINIERYYINPRACERCLLCYEACLKGAISVKGLTGTRQAPISPL